MKVKCFKPCSHCLLRTDKPLNSIVIDCDMFCSGKTNKPILTQCNILIYFRATSWIWICLLFEKNTSKYFLSMAFASA